ncbi:MAG TPA: hypothetical protein VLG14_06765 [Sphingomonas sp.]|nr:hypothetical protein [Sphingomonas sp.]
MPKALIAALALIAATPALAQIAPTEQTALDHAKMRGELIYWYDQAAWHGTDDMLARARDLAPTIGGWIVDGPADATELIFYSRGADPRPLYQVRFRDGKLAESRKLGEADTPMLTPQRRRMIAALAIARKALIEAKPTRCADKPFNTVALPPATPDGPVPVYFLTPQTEHGVLPLGGHYLFEVDAAGKTSAMRRFTNSCIALPTTDAGDKDGGRTAALYITHLLDPVPTEIHFFSAMAARKPIYVGIGEKVWSVTPSGRGAGASLIKAAK